MSLEELKKEVEGLTIEEQKRLRDHLQRKLTISLDNGDRYVRIMNSIVKRDILKKTREPMYVWARYMVAWQCLNDGLTELETGRVIRRDRSVICNIKRQMGRMLSYPSQYKKEMIVWQQFQEQIK